MRKTKITPERLPLSWGNRSVRERSKVVEQDRIFNRRKRSQSRRVIAVAKPKNTHLGVFFEAQVPFFSYLGFRNLRRLEIFKIVRYSTLTYVLFSTTITYKVPREKNVFLLSVLLWLASNTVYFYILANLLNAREYWLGAASNYKLASLGMSSPSGRTRATSHRCRG